jgi:hypothetical protein
VKKYRSHFAMLPVILFVSAASPVAAEASKFDLGQGQSGRKPSKWRSVLAHQWETRSFIFVHCSRPAAFKMFYVIAGAEAGWQGSADETAR